ncbi:MAG: glycosyltransferase family 4 protein [Tildeniella torsiva UHER 1998/13D]|jgi:glycosyltransferase involved in cell wall biosynthesis|nr:glycosyltransferase family 4 protein [Tildeniella torsiva UHER 1998/13D]
MKIWHFGASPSPDDVNGVNTAVWLIAQEQVSLGHEVTLILESIPNKSTSLFANMIGLNIAYIKTSRYSYDAFMIDALLESGFPDLIHLHSIFLLNQFFLAKKIFKNRIPYIITPHGGLNFSRSKLKKQVFSLLFEKEKMYKASAITVVTPREADRVCSYLPRYNQPIRWIPNPFNVSRLNGRAWKRDTTSKKVIFLGRFDVLQKGIDILAKIAYLSPEFDFHLYGRKDRKTGNELHKIQQDCPKNLHFHDPIYGEEKLDLLSEASIYIQTSRWEGFPMSIVEAMYLGLPCAISECLDMAELFREKGLGVLLSTDPRVASQQLADAFRNPKGFESFSETSRQFAISCFSPFNVAKQYLDLYEEVLS